jgi:hypothetical protein
VTLLSVGAVRDVKTGRCQKGSTFGGGGREWHGGGFSLLTGTVTRQICTRVIQKAKKPPGDQGGFLSERQIEFQMHVLIMHKRNDLKTSFVRHFVIQYLFLDFF